jgi:hypothetical protein
LLEKPKRGRRGVKSEEGRGKMEDGRVGLHFEKYQLRMEMQRLKVRVWVAMPQKA